MDAAVHAELKTKTIKDFTLAPATEAPLDDGAT
jgi:hypothetical protein